MGLGPSMVGVSPALMHSALMAWPMEPTARP